MSAGQAIVWPFDVANDASQPLVVDAYRLVGASPGLTIVGAAGWGIDPLSPAIGPGVPANEDARSAVAARPLVGWTFKPSTAGQAPQRIVFIVRADANGSYSVNSVVVRYHAGNQQFETQLASRFDLCVGADVPPGGTCPLATPSSSPASSGA